MQSQIRPASPLTTARSQADAPEIDGAVYLRNVPADLKAGDFAEVLVEDADAHDLYGVISPTG